MTTFLSPAPVNSTLAGLAHAGSAATAPSLRVGRVRINTPLNRTSPLYRGWMKLFDANRRASVLQHPDFVLGRLDEAGNRDEPLQIITAHRDEDLAGLAVLVPHHFRAGTFGRFVQPRQLPCLRLSGNRLLDGGDQQVSHALMAGIADELDAERRRFLLVEDLDTSSILWKLLEGCAERGFRLLYPSGVQSRHRIRLPENADDYWSAFSKNARKKNRKALRSFGEDCVKRYSAAGDVAEFLCQAARVSANSWQSRRYGQRVRDNESEVRKLSFLAGQGALRSYILFYEQAPVAFEFNIQFRRGIDSVEAAFDSRYADLSPGRALLIYALTDLFDDRRPDLYDFGGGDAEYKRLFANETTRSGNAWLIPPGLRNTAMYGLMKAARGFHRLARSVFDKAGLWQRIRRRIRGRK